MYMIHRKFSVTVGLKNCLSNISTDNLENWLEKLPECYTFLEKLPECEKLLECYTFLEKLPG